jgi:fluoride ion exporter CrcB/FEX
MTAKHRARPDRLRIVVAAARRLAPTMPWGALLAGCTGSLAISLAAYLFAEPLQQPADITLTVRAAFIPVVAAIAFGLSDPSRALAASLPAPSWLIVAVRLLIALPVLALTAWITFALAAAELGIDQRFAHLGRVRLPWPAYCAELATWSAFALAAAALVARTRWHDLGGAIGAPVALAFIAVAALTPLRLFPIAFIGLTPAQHSGWVRAQWIWWALGLMAALLTGWASRDPWLRVSVRSRGTRSPYGSRRKVACSSTRRTGTA